MNELIASLMEDLARGTEISDERRELFRELFTRVLSLAESETSTSDLRVAVTAIDELLEAFMLFDGFHDRPKVTIFGSARTTPTSPLYSMTEELARSLTGRGWITVTGAGPGIMEAAARGAGLEHTLGVNIDLPFEQSPNAFIDVSSMLVTMKYFFTRKVALTRSSIAFVFLPGGLGTMDELFEVLTLLDTGKTTPAPVVLLDAPGGHYWQRWHGFMDEAVIANGYLSSRELTLVRMVDSIDGAIEEIERFYVNYQGFAVDGERAVVTMRRAPTEAQLADLAERETRFSAYRVDDEHTLSFDFDGRSFVQLRRVIDVVNSWTD